MVIRPPMHELRPTAKDGGVCGKNTVALRYGIKPDLYLPGLLRVLSPGDLYSGLYFTDGHGGNVQRLFWRGLNPGNDALMGFPLAQLRNDIRVEEKHRSVNRSRRPTPQAPTRREAQSCPRLRGEKQRLQTRACPLI